MPDRSDMERLIDEHLAGPALRALPTDRLRRLRALLGAGDPPEAGEQARATVEPLGVAPQHAREELADLIDEIDALGMEPAHVAPVAQAYVRALGRIADAEAAHIRAQLVETPEAERAALLDRLLPGVVEAGARAFTTLHRVLLHDALSDELSDGPLGAAGDAVLTVALIDLTGSTTYLASASPGETHALVDGLFAAGQGAALDRPVRVVKYVGDGFFLVGRDPVAVIDACWAAVDRIQEQLPLRARAGVADGPLVRRAGDLFGLAVNLAQALTKAAKPGSVVVSGALAERLPTELRGVARTASLPGGRELALVSVRRD